jgi:hypothetical protein
MKTGDRVRVSCPTSIHQGKTGTLASTLPSAQGRIAIIKLANGKEIAEDMSAIRKEGR